MTKPILDNTLYVHLKSVINQAIPLEYALRAAKMANPHEFNKLSEIDLKIRQYWIELGSNDFEIDAESLMDFAWDTIQIGFPLSRRHGRVYPNGNFLKLLDRGLANVREAFYTDVCQVNLPAAQYFRICDLLNGNDVSLMLDSVAQCIQEAQGYKKSDDIELKKFVRSIRGPIHLHPGLEYIVDVCQKGEKSVRSFGLLLDTEIEFSITDLKRQIREFLYQFAIQRQSLRPSHSYDSISEKLVNEFMTDEIRGRSDKHTITRLDGFMSILTGLYCWDLAKQHNSEETELLIDRAIERTLDIYPKNIDQVDHDTIRSNYNVVRVAINEIKFTP